MRWLNVVGVAAMAATMMSGQQRVKPAAGFRDWKMSGGAGENIRYSALDQINRSNARELQVAWTHETGDAFEGSEMQCNPVVADGVLFATTPKLRVIALDAATGAMKWSFNPDEKRKNYGKSRNRGVTYWSDGKAKRLFFGYRHWIYSLDASTGKPDGTFGNEGRIDLREGLGRDPSTFSISATSPVVLYRDSFIVGGLTGESLPAAPGDIRAFDARTGKVLWAFHTIPHPGEPGYETWPKDGWKYLGAANNWSGMTVDEARGIVFVPTGSTAFDFYGANRPGDNLYANCLLALDAKTGKRLWHFQFVKHDVWDRDLPTPPSLITVKRNGKLVDAVSQATKSGFVFVFDRVTGESLFPIEWRKVDQHGVDGEVLSSPQALPLKPPPFARQQVTEDILTDRTPEAHAAALAQFRKTKTGPQFTPPSHEGTFVFPGFDGGAEWGGQAFDPESGLYYVNANEMAWILRIVDQPKVVSKENAHQLYQRHCASCHRADRKGTPPEFPSLLNLTKRYSDDEVVALIREGAGRMPAFSKLSGGERRAIARYAMSGEEDEAVDVAHVISPMDLKFTMDGYNKFLDPDGYPAIKPPWGTLNAINLDTGEIAWKIPFGEFPELAAKGLKNTGTENYGGPVVTAGGLLFIGATNHDRKFHVYDKATGELLWEYTLPFAGNATPAVYETDGRQFVVIAAGGGKSGAPSGGTYVAFALPKK
jgi:quinoprotein glucose dehydrogenase